MTRAKIIKAIGCPHLALHEGEGYFYFVYDDAALNRYDSQSVYVFRLNHLDFADWVRVGKCFVESVEAR